MGSSDFGANLAKARSDSPGFPEPGSGCITGPCLILAPRSVCDVHGTRVCVYMYIGTEDAGQVRLGVF